MPQLVVEGIYKHKTDETPVIYAKVGDHYYEARVFTPSKDNKSLLGVSPDFKVNSAQLPAAVTHRDPKGWHKLGAWKKKGDGGEGAQVVEGIYKNTGDKLRSIYSKVEDHYYLVRVFMPNKDKSGALAASPDLKVDSAQLPAAASKDAKGFEKLI